MGQAFDKVKGDFQGCVIVFFSQHEDFTQNKNKNLHRIFNLKITKDTKSFKIVFLKSYNWHRGLADIVLDYENTKFEEC